MGKGGLFGRAAFVAGVAVQAQAALRGQPLQQGIYGRQTARRRGGAAFVRARQVAEIEDARQQGPLPVFFGQGVQQLRQGRMGMEDETDVRHVGREGGQGTGRRGRGTAAHSQACLFQPCPAGPQGGLLDVQGQQQAARRGLAGQEKAVVTVAGRAVQQQGGLPAAAVAPGGQGPEYAAVRHGVQKRRPGRSQDRPGAEWACRPGGGHRICHD